MGTTAPHELPFGQQTESERIAATLKVLGKDARYRRLEHWWQRYKGLHYDSDVAELGALLEWDEDTDQKGNAVPLQKRKPLLRVNFGASLVNRLVDLLAQPPTLHFVGPDGQVLADADEAWKRIAKRVDFEGIWSEATPYGLATGSLCVAGYIPVANAKRVGVVQYPSFQAWPVLVADLYGATGRSLQLPAGELDALRQAAERNLLEDDEVVYLDVKSIWLDDDDDPTIGKKRTFLSRRVFWPDRVVTYRDLDVTDWPLNQAIPPGTVDREVKHDLGFVPAVWVRTQRVKDEVDGAPLLEGVETLCDAVDRMESQRFRGCTYHGDGTLAPDDAEAANALNALDSDQKVEVGAKRVLPVPMRMVETSGAGQKTQADFVNDLKEEIQHRVGVRLPDPEKITGQLAAAALEQLDQTTVAKVNQLRNAWGRGRTQLARYLMLLAVRAGVEKPSDLPSDRTKWSVVADWPPVYAPNAQDRLQETNAAAAAADTITDAARTRHVARAWGIADPDAEAKAKAKEREEQQQEMMDQLRRATREPGAGGVSRDQRPTTPGQQPRLAGPQRSGQSGQAPGAPKE